MMKNICGIRRQVFLSPRWGLIIYSSLHPGLRNPVGLLTPGYVLSLLRSFRQSRREWHTSKGSAGELGVLRILGVLFFAPGCAKK